MPTNLSDDGYEALQASKNTRPTAAMMQTAEAMRTYPGSP